MIRNHLSQSLIQEKPPHKQKQNYNESKHSLKATKKKINQTALFKSSINVKQKYIYNINIHTQLHSSSKTHTRKQRSPIIHNRQKCVHVQLLGRLYMYTSAHRISHKLTRNRPTNSYTNTTKKKTKPQALSSAPNSDLTPPHFFSHHPKPNNDRFNYEMLVCDCSRVEAAILSNSCTIDDYRSKYALYIFRSHYMHSI